jgi:hypothetical protein
MVHDRQLREAGFLGGTGHGSQIFGHRGRPSGPGEVRDVQSDFHLFTLILGQSPIPLPAGTRIVIALPA